jgi:biotin transporter BioY
MQKKVANLRYFKFIDNYPRFTPGTLIVTLLCSFLIVMATFSQIKFGHLTVPEELLISPSDFFSSGFSLDRFVKYFYYIPQIPAILFIGALLGPRAGLIAVFIYFIAGIAGLPVFALGGGIKYIAQQGFGYILGYFLGAYVVGVMLKEKVTNFSLIRATVAGVLAIHLIGILYLTVSMYFQHQQLFLILSWIWVLSGMQIIYDLIIAFFAVAAARPIRSLLWVVMD